MAETTPVSLEEARSAQKGTVSVIIVDDCKVGGKHVEMGEVIDFNLGNAGDRSTLAALHQAGRVSEVTDKVKEDVKQRRDARDKVFSKARATAESSVAAPAASQESINAAVDAAVAKALAAAGVNPMPPKDPKAKDGK